MTGSAVWRAEHGHIHPGEVDALQAGLKKVEDRIAAGEFVKAVAEPKPRPQGGEGARLRGDDHRLSRPRTMRLSRGDERDAARIRAMDVTRGAALLVSA